MRSMLRDLLPPALVRLVRRARGRSPMRYSGPFADWDEAAAHATGYAAPAILDRARATAMALRRGAIAFERDTVPCARLEPPFPVVAGLLDAAVASGGRLSVLDFGGALGSSLHQCRPLLGACSSLCWGVVEQEHFVRCGRAEFEDDTLRFHGTIAECVACARPNAALLSGVLHYLPNPFDTLREVFDSGVESIIIDRTPFASIARDLTAVQQVPASIYDASYPMWVFARTRFMEFLCDHGRVVAEFEGRVDAPSSVGTTPFQFGGLIIRNGRPTGPAERDRLSRA